MPEAGRIEASIDFDARGLQAAVDAAMKRATRTIGNQIDTAMDRAEGRIKSGFRKAGALAVGFLGLEAVASKLVQAGTYIATLGAKTEKTLNTFQSVSKATATQMEQVSARAKELGNDITIPGASAADAAETMTELAKAGLSVEESMLAARGTMQLAAAAQIEGAQAAEIQGSALNAFSLGAKEAGRVADVLANSANASAAEITDTAQALAQAGAVAASAGLSIEETATFLSQFANAGIRGSDAGTLLKTMLMRLRAPSGVAAKEMERLGLSVFDANGNMVDSREIVKRLIEATEGMTEADRSAALAKVFGADAIRGVNVLLEQGLDVHDKTAEAMRRQGAAAEVAAARSKGLSGAIGAAVSVMESLAIEIYQGVSPALDDLLREGLDRLPGAIDQARAYVLAFLDAMEPAADIVAAFIEAASPGAVVAFKVAMASLLGVVKTVGLVLEPVANFLEANEAALEAVVGPLVAATIAYKAFTRAVSAGRTFRAEVVSSYGQAVDSVRKKFDGATTAASRFRVVGSGLMGAMGGPWGIALAAGVTALGAFSAKQAETEASVNSLKETLDRQTGAITRNSIEWARNSLSKQGVLDDAKALGINLGDLVNAVLGEEDALTRVNAVLSQYENNTGASAATTRAMAGGVSGTTKVLGEEASKAEAVANALGVLTGRRKRATTEARLEAEATRQAKNAKDRAAATTQVLAGHEAKLRGDVYATNTSLDKQADSARGARRALAGLRNEAIKGINSQIDLEESSDNLRKTVRRLTKAGLSNKKMLDISTPAGRDLYRAFIDLATSSVNVEGGMKRARRQIFNTIRPMVESDRKAWKLTNQFFKLDEAAGQAGSNNVDIPVSAPGLERTLSRLNTLRSRAADIDGMSVTTYQYEKRILQIERQRKAKGGPVYGSGTGTSDSVPALLSNGEHVFTAREVDAAGGHGNIMRLRKAILAGAVKFAEGGGIDLGYGPKMSQVSMRPLGADEQAASLVGQLSLSVGSKADLPEALDETMFHLRRIKRGGRP